MIARVPIEVRPEIQHALGSLKARIRTYVLMEGLALVGVLMGLAFWLSLAVDHFYFWLSNLELPVWFRAGYVSVVAGVSVFAFVSWVLLRLFRTIRLRALALVLERRFPELNDRLITAVEVSDSMSGHESQLTIAMLERTVADVALVTQKLDVGEVFNKTPVRRAVWTAIILLVSVLGFGVADADAFQRWAQAFLGWNDHYWVRETDLVARVIAQPGDRIKNFRNSAGNSTVGRPGVYKHPRGGDLTILIEVPTPKDLVTRQQRVRTRVETLLAPKPAVSPKSADKKTNLESKTASAAVKTVKTAQPNDDDKPPVVDPVKPAPPAKTSDSSECDEPAAEPVPAEKKNAEKNAGAPLDGTAPDATAVPEKPADAAPVASDKAKTKSVANDGRLLEFRKLRIEQRQIQRELDGLPHQLQLSLSQIALVNRAVSQFDGEIDKIDLDALSAAEEALRQHLGEVEWVVPERVRLDYRLESGSSNRVFLVPTSDGQFRYTISNLQDNVTFWFKGHDFANREAYRVEIVDPPKIDGMVLAPVYPAYTKMNERLPRLKHVQGTQVELPEETHFTMRAESNKPLTRARIQADTFEITLTPMQANGVGLAELTVFATEQQPLQEFGLPDQVLYRFRQFKAEASIHEKVDRAKRRIRRLEDRKDESNELITEGAVAALKPETAATALKEVHEIHQLIASANVDFAKFVDGLDDQPAAMREFLKSSVQTPLDELDNEGFAKLTESLEALRTAKADADVRVLESRFLAEVLEARIDAVLYELCDGSQFQLDFWLTNKSKTADGVADGGMIPLAPNQALRVYLEDTDDIVAAEPSHLRIDGIEDTPPAFDNLGPIGIGDVITRKARVPYKGIIRDDYGIFDARFHFKIDEEAEWQSRRFFNPPADQPAEFVLQRAEDTPFEYFEVLPLDLNVGQQLKLTVYAADGDDLNGPHTSRTKEYKFQIVTAEELLALLYAKEINMRRQFEQTIKEVDESRLALVENRLQLEQIKQFGEVSGEDASKKEELERLIQKLDTSPDRLLSKIAKNKSECEGVQVSFRDILDELVNNAVHTEKMVERIDELIVKRLQSINEKDFEAVDGALRLFKRSLDPKWKDDPNDRIGDSIRELDLMLIHMREVLAEMEDLAEFHEAITNLKKIITDQGGLIKDTGNEATKEAIKKLKGLEGLQGEDKTKPTEKSPTEKKPVEKQP
ncbi:MAG: hypothetical protein O3A00_02160 [Planctomycetota bacterium]|nr:hypothetical protein [Planctomycetota bacterium]